MNIYLDKRLSAQPWRAMVRPERFLTEARRFSLLPSMPEFEGQLLTLRHEARERRIISKCETFR